ncbi:DUF4236 domain-containing protein [Spirosoma sp. SC4-14]|uniref:DUF4236 domain-containing protein n=1 Tax=Spirosoma sp. SC4-14 TaxID=3128900 RepID=UPI0030D5AC24
MAWRYSKRIKIIPGVRINLSSRGISTTIGVRGASLNVSSRGTYLNVGIPGTGLSYREKLGGARPSQQPASLPAPEQPRLPEVPHGFYLPSHLDNILTLDIQEVTSQDMAGIKETILLAHQQRQELGTEIPKVQRALGTTKMKLLLSRIVLLNLFKKSIIEELKTDIETQQETLKALASGVEGSLMNLEIELEGDIKFNYLRTANLFNALAQSKKIWDITGSYYQDRVVTRSAASTSVKRTITQVDLKNLDEISCTYPAFHFHNQNGADIYIYPDFIIMFSSIREFAIIGYHELKLGFSSVQFVEEEGVPADSKVVSHTWAKVNKNGQPDRRFKDNYQIPVTLYGELEFKTNSGLHEGFQFSNHDACRDFYISFVEYQKILAKLKRYSEA